MAKEKNQAAKFRETARELGCDESEERFDEALRAVAKHKPPTREKASEKDQK
jgi:hypothetical protein